MGNTEEIVSVIEAFRDHIAKATGVNALLEPQPVRLHEPHLRIMAPTGWEFQFEDFTTNETARLYTVQVDALVALTAYGDGPDVYLSECMKASFKVNRYFRNPVTIKLWNAAGAGNISVNGKRKPGGQHFRNDEAEKGSKPYLYEESWDVSLFFPYAELI